MLNSRKKQRVSTFIQCKLSKFNLSKCNYLVKINQFPKKAYMNTRAKAIAIKSNPQLN
ncbi:uncharacterized protein DS421_15g505970 [Arachis hypogaea]|nr:uncharacterized protein DS421_15g505970 [Arachis hypogaea]